MKTTEARMRDDLTPLGQLNRPVIRSVVGAQFPLHPYTRRREAPSVDLVRASLGYGSPTNFQVGSGSYSVTAAATSAVSGPRFFSYTRPC